MWLNILVIRRAWIHLCISKWMRLMVHVNKKNFAFVFKTKCMTLHVHVRVMCGSRKYPNPPRKVHTHTHTRTPHWNFQFSFILSFKILGPPVPLGNFQWPSMGCGVGMDIFWNPTINGFAYMNMSHVCMYCI